MNLFDVITKKTFTVTMWDEWDEDVVFGVSQKDVVQMWCIFKKGRINILANPNRAHIETRLAKSLKFLH
ncbi:hypothetical protein D0T57_01230 [Dysgonomonas sp. 511]|nr:hypothetical protein [Dysgonomonas sp. 511]